MAFPDFNLTAVMELRRGDGVPVETFQLRVDRIAHTIGRNPVIFSLPGIQEPALSGMPKFFSLDFGMMTEHIVLSGVLPDFEPLTGTSTPNSPIDPYFPSHSQLSNIVRSWWRFAFESTDFSVTNYNMLSLAESGGPGITRYGVLIQNLTCGRLGGETKWTYKLTLAVVDFTAAGRL